MQISNLTREFEQHQTRLEELYAEYVLINGGYKEVTP